MSVSELVFATHNAHKLQEIHELLPARYKVLSLTDLAFHDDIEETGATIEENSHLKSATIYQKFGKPCFADDSGLEVAALHGAPGVYSARYAGPKKDDRANWMKLLDEMKGLSQGERRAQFKSVITLFLSEDDVVQFEGIIKGQIVRAPRGDKGFGYDPVFTPEGHDRTFAEMDAWEKNKISHRAVAVDKLVTYLSSL
ncbi:MAG: RdgB/HAM1 family non-canonical purine NTP pyrophosphatase [Bacteroidota bacterium]